MEPNLYYIRQLVREHDWSGSELARRMGISRAEANRFLNGQRKGGKKLISGLLKAFPAESLETLFILPSVYPNVNIKEESETYEVSTVAPATHPPPKPSVAKKVMKPVRHPSAHHIACSINEETGTVEIVDGRNITTLLVPAGPIEVRHTTKPTADTS
ncbi:MAG: helix-turn-helix domain-containing protein [Eubacteriales bacterium]